MPAPKPGARTTGSQAGEDKVSAAYQDLLQEIVEKRKQAAEIKRRPAKKKKGPVVKAALAVILSPIVAAVWIFQPFAPPPIEPVRPPDDVGAWQTALLGGAQRIMDWRDSAGLLPRSLEEAGVPLPGASYEATGESTFVIRGFAGDRPVAIYGDGHRLGIGAAPVHPVAPAAPSVFFP
ncbi:MAG: hypothetical protein ABJB33_00345 [Gemmatimonadota bacterium]